MCFDQFRYIAADFFNLVRYSAHYKVDNIFRPRNTVYFLPINIITPSFAQRKGPACSGDVPHLFFKNSAVLHYNSSTSNT